MGYNKKQKRNKKGRGTEMKFLVLDGNSILNRAFYGIKLLSTKEGYFTNAIYGFFSMMQHLLDEIHPDCVVAAFDLKAPTFRHKAYDGYKANRKGMPEELAQQLPVVKHLLELLGYSVLTCEGYEADDILGTLARMCEEKSCECVIATGDRDSLQLVSDHVTVRITATKMGKPEVTLYNKEKIREDYGIEPKQLIEVKALQGDSSDNIPGVAGIGPKGALDLIRQYGNIDAIYDHLDQLEMRETLRAKLVAGKDSAFMSRMLGTICTEAPISTDPLQYERKTADYQTVINELTRLECFSLIDKLGLREASSLIPPQVTESEVEEPIKVLRLEQPQELFATLTAEGKAFFTVKTDENKLKEIVILCGETVFISGKEDAPFAELCRFLFCSENILKITHDIKPIYASLSTEGISDRGNWFDIALAAYLLNPSATNYAADRLTEQHATVKNTEGLDGQYKKDAEIVAALPQLYEKFASEIAENGQEKLLYDVEIPLARVLAEMEISGVAVDGKGIEQYGILLDMKIQLLQELICEQAGYRFNINSPKQLGEALFEKMLIPCGKKTKTGYSTSAEVLEELKDTYPIIADVLEYRMLSKLKSTYCDGLTKMIDENGRIHSNFKQMETRTGRISSTEPNLQNIPTRTEEGRELRRYFKAKDGCVLIDADYSQIELRVLAHTSQDKVMVDAFVNNEDVHKITASQVFGLPIDLVTPQMRSRAKTVNFGIVYGIGAFSLASDLKISRAEANNYIKSYFKHYQGIENYMKQSVDQARECGYAKTEFGRRRYLPELSVTNANLRKFGERVARNMPIQGAAADIIKIAMIKVRNRLKEEGLTAKLILQVHDELILEAPEHEAVKAMEILKSEMEHAVELSVPLTVDVNVGRTWYDAKG